MNLKTYAKYAKTTMANTTSVFNDCIHMILGITTETGELADIFKKNLAYKKDIDYINVEEEIGDLMWYIINLCTVLGFDLEKILDKNIAKLKTRYPNKFEADKALNRNLTSERSILESNVSTWDDILETCTPETGIRRWD